MEGKMDELVARFHALQCNNLQEIKRNFNELIEAIRRDVPLESDLDVLIESIRPKTKFENVLKVEVLIRFKKYDELLEILKGGNPMLIGKVLKCWKFFEDFFIKIDPQTVINQVFSETSFSTRVKIITRLSTSLKNEELADDYFHAIEDKYGLCMASRLLPACGLELIKSTVATYKLNLTSKQLLRIFKRDREFLEYYFDVLRQAHGENFDFSGKYRQVLRYVAKVDEQLFWKVFKKYKLMSKFGRHMTPRLYESGKEVVTTSDYNQRLFNLKKLYKIIVKNEEDLRHFILQLLPKKSDAFTTEYLSYCLKTLTTYISKNKKYEVLNSCFEKAYGKSIHELLSVDTPEDIMEFMPVHEREIIVDKKVLSNEDWIYMYPPRKAITLLKERIKLTSSIRRRSSLALQLIKTCLVNRDSESLLDVLKYMNSRHRNDNIILEDFMLSLQEWPNLEKLTGEHWTYINEFLNICTRMPRYRLYSHDVNYMLRYVMHLIENKIPCEEFMETFLKHIKDIVGHFGEFYSRNLPKCEKLCYQHFARLLPELYTGDEFTEFACSFLESLIYHNAQNPKYKITISQYPLLLDALKIQLATRNYYCAEVVLRYYLKHEDDGRGDEFFWDNYEKTCNADMIIWYLQKRPNKILEHLDKILTPPSIKQLRYRLPKTLYLMSMLPTISEKIISFSLKALHDNDVGLSKFAAASLSYLTTKEKYLEIARSFIPLSHGQIDLKVGKQNLVPTQEAVVDGLANLDDPTSTLPILLEFCVVDYIKYASKSLHHIASNTPESKLDFFLNSLYSSAVSVRKHAVNITARLSPKSMVYTFLKNSGQNDKDPSLRKTIFKSTFWFFTANPTEEFWDLLKDNVKIIDENDRETFGYLVNLHKIPNMFLSESILMVYTVLSENKNEKIQAKKYDFLAAIRNDSVAQLNVMFLTTVIKDTFPNAIQKTDFYLKCLFYTTRSDRTLMLNLIFNILKDRMEKGFFVNENRRDLYDIIHAICVKAVALRVGKELVEKFMKLWSSTKEQGKYLEEYLLLQFTNVYLSLRPEDNLGEYAVKVSEVFEECVGLYDSSIIAILTEQLSDFLNNIPQFDSDERKQFEFIDGLLLANGADFNYTLALNLLFDRVPWNEINNQYSTVLMKIREYESPVVQIYLHRRLKNVQDKKTK